MVLVVVLRFLNEERKYGGIEAKCKAVLRLASMKCVTQMFLSLNVFLSFCLFRNPNLSSCL